MKYEKLHYIGCHVRAHIYMKKITNALRKKYHGTGKIFELPKKHFVFGRLRLETKNAPHHGDEVLWRMHVAPIIKLWNNTHNYLDFFMLDPGVSTIPITRDEWYRQITIDPLDDITGFVTCEPGAYSMFITYCFNPEDATDEYDPNLDSINDIALLHHEVFLEW